MLKKERFFLLVFIIVISMGVLFFPSCDKGEKENIKKEIKIGVIVPLTGQWSYYGNQFKRGIELWKKQNPKTEIKILYEDNQANPKDSIAAFNKLCDEGVVTILSGFSSVMLTLGPLANSKQIVLINGGATNPDIKKAGNFVFNMIPDAEIEASFIANFIVNELKVKESVIYWQNNDAGKGMMETFKDVYNAKGGKIIENLSHDPTQIDFKNDLIKIIKTNVKVVFVPTYDKQLAQIVKQAMEIGIENILWICYASAQTDDMIRITKNSSDGRVLYSYYSYDIEGEFSIEKQKKFSEEFEKTYDQKPSIYAATYYDAISILSEAIGKNNTTPIKIQNYIYHLKNYSGVLGELHFNGKNYVTSGVKMKMISKGKFVEYNKDLINVNLSVH